MKTKLLLLLAIISVNCFAQFSKTHYIPPISCSNTQVPSGQSMYISCPSITPISFRIISLGGGIINGTVSRDTPYVLNIGGNANTQIMVDQNSASAILNNKGYIIEADDLVYASVRISAAFHAGSIVSKGLAALGTKFRIGGFLNLGAPAYSDNHYTFASILATENNTVVSFSDINAGVTLVNNGGAGNTPANITLNSGQSYVIAVQGPTNANRDGLIGALITSDKPIAVNCGSVAGSNSFSSNLDFGLDQIVSAERTGKEYILIKGLGNSFDPIEKALIIAHENNTEIFVNGNATPVATIQAGDYFALDGNNYTANRNLYIRTSKNVFVYQSIGGSDTGNASDQANQNMHFVPPLSCETPKIVNNIPLINEVAGLNNFFGTVMVVTETAANLTFIINGVTYTPATLPAGVTLVGPNNVTGNTAYQTYSLNGLSGNISVLSTKQVYVSYFGSSGAATYGGFYSGFTFKPEITQDIIAVGQTNCIPNAKLTVSSISSFDDFQWFFNDVAIPGATSNQYIPTAPGYYNVRATILACGTTLISDKIPVSSCPTNGDGDLVNDNIDIDLDNDGITNCTESNGNQNIDTSVTNGAVPTSTTTYVTSTVNSVPAAPTPFVGNGDGSFVSEVLAGKGYNVVFNTQFSVPTNVTLSYPTTALASDLLNANAEYIVNSDTNKTLTIVNPTNQLLIDTNYDGIYESGITQYSSFEIRFRINGTTPIAAGTGTFGIQSFQTLNFKITHKNLLDSAANKSTFKLFATCVYKDNDSDSTPDQLDTDSDNDGIPDVTEAQVNAAVVIANADTNLNGLDNAFETGFTPIDTDLDLVPDYLDLDSDNDGILDFNESIADTDGDGIKNYRELDSDNDLCNDVNEAGFAGNPDSNGDGLLGAVAPVTVNANGQVTSGTGGYVTPTANYITFAPIVITTQPIVVPTCELENASITLADNGGNTYQWQLSTDGGVTFNNLLNVAPYSNVTTNTLNLTSVTNSMNGYQYRVILNKVGNSCGLTSAATTLTVYILPTVTSPIQLIQCDDNADLISVFNLTQKNNIISTNYLNETFTYYTSAAGANTANAAQLIATPTSYTNTTAGAMSVWTRVENSNGCFRVARIDLLVLLTQIPITYRFPIPTVCDDTLDNDTANPLSPLINRRDGVSTFDFSSAENTPVTGIRAQLPAGNYTITYYRNQSDAQSEINKITDTANYRNIGYPFTQSIWVRIDSDIDNACYGLGPFIQLNVERLPYANPVIIARQCDNDQDGNFNFDTSTLHATLLGNNNGAPNLPVTVTYFDATNNPLTSPFPATFLTASQTIRARVTNNSTLACYDETTITFIVDDLPEALPLTSSVETRKCDDEINPSDQDGIATFNTANLESDIRGTQTGLVITYTDNAGNPLLDFNGVQIVSPFPTTFKTTSRTIRVVVTKSVIVAGVTLNTCSAPTRDIIFTVDAVPKINLTGNELVCTNLSTFNVTIDAGIIDGSPITDYTYKWFRDGTNIGISTYSYTTFQEGIYTVEVRNTLGCTRTRTITVVGSIIPTILPSTIVELSDNNSITINVSGNGDYVYSLDEEFGPFQPENIFPNVTAGIHTVYVKDLNGCGVSQKVVNVLGAPKYFTPNGDGIHDYWNVRGISSTYNSKTVIYIFDRFGKLIKQIAPLEQGWNGTFNGQPLPASDYWYTIQFEDGKTAKGNFSLKR